MILLRSSHASEGKFDGRFADQPANTMPALNLRL